MRTNIEKTTRDKLRLKYEIEKKNQNFTKELRKKRIGTKYEEKIN
jgi:hypothetical protein